MIIKHVTKGTVSQVMAEPRNAHIVYVSIIDLQPRLLLFKLLHDLSRYVTRPYAMLKSVVHGRGENIVDTTELLEVA